MKVTIKPHPLFKAHYIHGTGRPGRQRYGHHQPSDYVVAVNGRQVGSLTYHRALWRLRWWGGGSGAEDTFMDGWRDGKRVTGFKLACEHARTHVPKTLLEVN